jgi:hypothetical protein
VTLNEVAVPDPDDDGWVPPSCADRFNAAVRSLFALDIFAIFYISTTHEKKWDKVNRTSTLGFAEPGADTPRRRTNHTHALRLIERADLLLGLTKRHSVLQFP